MIVEVGAGIDRPSWAVAMVMAWARMDECPIGTAEIYTLDVELMDQID